MEVISETKKNQDKITRRLAMRCRMLWGIFIFYLYFPILGILSEGSGSPPALAVVVQPLRQHSIGSLPGGPGAQPVGCRWGGSTKPTAQPSGREGVWME